MGWETRWRPALLSRVLAKSTLGRYPCPRAATYQFRSDSQPLGRNHAGMDQTMPIQR
jgi:hypothetical protein